MSNKPDIILAGLYKEILALQKKVARLETKEVPLASAFAGAAHTHDGADIATGTVVDARIDALIARDAEVFGIVLANDGVGSGLNADLLDGLEPTAFAAVVHVHSGADITSGTVAESRIDASVTRDSEVFGIVLAADGPSTGLNADLLDNLEATAFLRVDGSLPLTADWDIGSGRAIKARIIRARTTDGLGLYALGSDEGLSIDNSGNVTMNTGRYLGIRVIRALDVNGLTLANASGVLIMHLVSGTLNVGIGTETQFGGGEGVIGIANRGVAPGSTPSNGGVLYVSGGSLRYKGSSGSDNQIAPA